MSDPLRQLLSEEEGRRAQPYYDSLGFVTGGVGHLFDPRKPCPIPEHIIDALLEADIAEKRAQAEKIPGFDKLNKVQQAVMISMVFQLGFEPFDGDGHHDFKNMLAALEKGDAKAAAAAGLDSLWAKQVPKRAQRAMSMLSSGLWIPQ